VSVAELAAEKRAMRAAAQVRREAAHAADSEAGERLAERFLDSHRLPPGTAISGFWPKGSEIDLRPLLYRLHEHGHHCLLPVVLGRGRALGFRCWTPDTPLVEGVFGVATPGPTAAEGVPSFVICPLLAFDRRGYRLGYGGGFYDRTLRALRRAAPVTAVGVGYAAQQVPVVPHDDSDEPLDGIVTETGPVRLVDRD
jgi:5-formyltetrahydrofolate cyclo-ligase